MVSREWLTLGYLAFVSMAILAYQSRATAVALVGFLIGMVWGVTAGQIAIKYLLTDLTAFGMTIVRSGAGIIVGTIVKREVEQYAGDLV